MSPTHIHFILKLPPPPQKKNTHAKTTSKHKICIQTSAPFPIQTHTHTCVCTHTHTYMCVYTNTYTHLLEAGWRQLEMSPIHTNANRWAVSKSANCPSESEHGAFSLSALQMTVIIVTTISNPPDSPSSLLLSLQWDNPLQINSYEMKYCL